jgi:hypothetical protein
MTQALYAHMNNKTIKIMFVEKLNNWLNDSGDSQLFGYADILKYLI